MNRSVLIKIVETDLTQSEIGRTFPGTFAVLRNRGVDHGHEVEHEVGEEEGHEMAIGDNDAHHALVAWQWTGVHQGALPHAKAFGTPVAIEGVTYVDWGLDSTLDTVDLRRVIVARFINWADVYAQVGVLPGRQVEPASA